MKPSACETPPPSRESVPRSMASYSLCSRLYLEVFNHCTPKTISVSSAEDHGAHQGPLEQILLGPG